MVIVEGPDGAGKSMLVAKLVEELKLEVQPRACTSDNAIDPRTLKDWVDADMSKPVHTSMIYDRHPLISEPIYGPIIRGRMADGFDDPWWLIHRLLMLDEKEPRFIYCLPSWRQVYENIQTGHQPTTKHLTGLLQKAKAIYDQYVYRAALASATSGLGVATIYDYTEQGSLPEVLQFARIGRK